MQAVQEKVPHAIENRFINLCTIYYMQMLPPPPVFTLDAPRLSQEYKKKEKGKKQ